MASIFAELQMLSEASKESTVLNARKQLNQIVDFMEHRSSYLEQLTIFAEYVRQLKVETLQNAHGFMVEDDMPVMELPEDLQHDSLGFCSGDRLVFSGRFVYPVFDVKGDVMGFCGYDKFEDPKYLDSINYGYKAKTYSCYGMEKLPEYYRSNDIVIFVEGIVCCLYLREMGIQALAMLGSGLSPYMLEVVKRFGKRAVVMMDADAAGIKLKKKLSYVAQEVRTVQSRVAKDIDDSRMVDADFYKEITKLIQPFYRSPMLK